VPILTSLASLVVAQRALLRARRRLKRQPIGSLAVRGSGPTTPATGDAERAEEIARSVVRTANHGLFRPFCLVRAMAIHDLLERADIRGSEIRIGVRRRAGEFAAHAWVRWNDRVLGDSEEHVASFTEVDDIRLLGEQ
jgi:hypothetical protein